jgi:hypothetical protein
MKTEVWFQEGEPVKVLSEFERTMNEPRIDAAGQLIKGVRQAITIFQAYEGGKLFMSVIFNVISEAELRMANLAAGGQLPPGMPRA